MIAIFKDCEDWQELDNWNVSERDFLPAKGDEVMLRIKGVEQKHEVVRRLAIHRGMVILYVREMDN